MPPTKVLKTSGTNATNAVTRVGRVCRGGLKDMPTMPLDILLEVCQSTYLKSPLDHPHCPPMLTVIHCTVVIDLQVDESKRPAHAGADQQRLQSVLDESAVGSLLARDSKECQESAPMPPIPQRTGLCQSAVLHALSCQSATLRAGGLGLTLGLSPRAVPNRTFRQSFGPFSHVIVRVAELPSESADTSRREIH